MKNYYEKSETREGKALNMLESSPKAIMFAFSIAIICTLAIVSYLNYILD